LISIENDLFFGLSNLYNLYLLSQNEMTFYNSSFHHLPNISTIVLNESLISKYKCLFMNNLQRDIQRNVSNKYIFYKSVNLIYLGFKFNDSLKNLKCYLMFHLFQFKIHFNLKSDYDNHLFYDSCEKILIKSENIFNHNKKNCLANLVFDPKEEDIEMFSPINRILEVFSNFYFLLSLLLILTLIVPSFYTIIRYELCLYSKSNRTKESSKQTKILLKEIEIKKSRNREMLRKLHKKVSELKSMIQKIENDFLLIEDKRKSVLLKSKTLENEFVSDSVCFNKNKIF